MRKYVDVRCYVTPDFKHKIKRIACKILNLTHLGIVMCIGTTMKASMVANLPVLMS